MQANASDQNFFLNVDLVLYSRTDLQPLVSAMGERVIVLYLGREHRAYKACLEVSGLTKNPESTLRAFCKLVRELPPSARKLWFGAKTRMFDIGIDSVPEGTYWFEISSETVAELAKLKAKLAVTVYGKLKKARSPRKARTVA
jgi:hypothetical protein